MPDLVRLVFDDEQAGGAATWTETTVPGALPSGGDWVWDGDSRLYVVERLGWTFVQDHSTAARQGDRTPIVRVHVRRVTPPEVLR